jgi:hypothetical protein
MSPCRPYARAPHPAQQTRVRWWALALPLAAFVSLLYLLSASTGTAGDRAGYPGLDRVERALPGIVLNMVR